MTSLLGLILLRNSGPLLLIHQTLVKPIPIPYLLLLHSRLPSHHGCPYYPSSRVRYPPPLGLSLDGGHADSVLLLRSITSLPALKASLADIPFAAPVGRYATSIQTTEQTALGLVPQRQDVQQYLDNWQNQWNGLGTGAQGPRSPNPEE